MDWDPYDRANKTTISLIQEAIQCGYDTPEVYLLLAKAYHGSRNYGLALDEIDQLLETLKNNDHKKSMTVEVLCVRAKILVEMGMYQEADETFLSAKGLDADLFSQHLWINPISFEEDILIRSLIEMKFDVQKRWTLDAMIRLFAFSYGRSIFDLVTSQDGKTIIELKTELDRLDKVYPKIMKELKKTIGEENWLSLRQKKKI